MKTKLTLRDLVTAPIQTIRRHSLLLWRANRRANELAKWGNWDDTLANHRELLAWRRAEILRRIRIAKNRLQVECAWCRCIITPGDPLIGISHGICQPCATREFAAFRASLN